MGPMSDRWGRRKIVLWSLLGYLLATVICALAPFYETLLFGRALQGVMAAGSLVASRAMIRDAFPPQEAQKAMAMVMMLFAVAPALAPIIGGWLEVHSGWRSVFYFLAIYAGLILILFYLRIGETQQVEHVQSIHPLSITRSYWHSLMHPHFLRLVVAQGLLVGGFFVYVVGSTSLIFDHLHLQEQDFWVFFVPVVAGILIGSFGSHRLAHKLSAPRVISLALLFGLFSVVSNMALESWFDQPRVWWVVGPLVFYAIGFALANPALSIVALDCLPSKRGLAASVQSLMQMGTAALVASFVVPLVHHSLWLMACSQALMLLIAGALWLSVRHQLSD
ncbi:MFS transporter [Thiomicrorhabdus sp. zzn3]|uniref:MFS transporter n=1 Tax=Thiomicrorhabdus sp. zzn3 TaxID=3039775 RepID=UPI002436B6ED|nr:MFS transporter [Thiomicrorhabdus sp. zzn3]MDG6777733.1 MFS transporter [Thiomicrorhabdus sp. zzn3]